jgi:hypothetical protein
MIIGTSQPLATYITEHELPGTGRARVFELQLRYQVEESKQQKVLRWRWTYTGAQEAVDRSNGRNGYRARIALEKQTFIRQVLRELRQRGEKLYSVEGQEILSRGKSARENPANA